MASLSSPELQVTLNLEKGDDSLNSRNITFKADGGSLQIGRASKTERKQLVPAGDNMWISNPVISREHAVLSVEKDALVEQLVVFLEDYRSSHGTFVNKVDIKTKGKAQLKSGDVVQFGDHVLRGTESFEPPVFRVQINSVINDAIPQRPSPGRSISVPENCSDGSGTDESDSQVGSVDSHSSPPHWGEEKASDANILPGSSADNPFTIDDAFVQRTTIVIEDVPSRDVSEDYEPSDNLDAGVYFQGIEPEDDDDIPDFDAESEHDNYPEVPDVPLARPESPVYAPTSPSRHIEPPVAEAGALPYSVWSPSPTQPNFEPHVYTQGPFAQPSTYSQLVSQPFSFSDDMLFPAGFTNRQLQSTVDPVSKTQAEDSIVDWMVPSLRPLSPAAVATATNITSTTQEFLNVDNVAERARTNKNNMSIKSLINPPVAAGTKRKVIDISDDELEPEAEDVDAASVEVEVVEGVEPMIDGATGGKKEEHVVLVRPVLSTDAVAPTAAEEERPAKRRRTLVSHFGSFALGGIAVFAGLVCLPDNYFG